LLYMVTRDGEMPRQFMRLNRHGVPFLPLLIAVGLPIVVVLAAADFTALAGLYAIGVVGAITVNVGSCAVNRTVGFTWYDHVLFGITFVILGAVEFTLAHTKPDALFFVTCVLIGGLGLRAYTLKRSGITTLTVTRQVAEMVSPTLVATMQPRLEEGQRIMVAARGITPVLSYALDEAQLRKASLYVVFVKEIAVYYGAGPVRAGRARWQEDSEANAILSLMLKLGCERDIPVMPVYAVSDDPAATILDLAATLGVDFLMIGTSHRLTLTNLLRGNVVTNIAAQLPDTIRLIIYG
jgi:nucleotide-binding universal stress UspA family protein